MTGLRAADVRCLYLRAMRAALRERSIVINTLLMPIFLYPLLLWLAYSGISFVGGQTRGFSSRIMLLGVPDEHRRFQGEIERDRRYELHAARDPAVEIRGGSLDALVEFLPTD